MPSRARSAADPARGWGGDALDLDAYLERIGHRGPVAPDAETLTAVHRAHSAAIPFENIDVLLGREIPLDVEALQDKMVRRGRGGYCYEHGLLLAAALERIGLQATGHAARVRVGGGLRPATHMALTVETPSGAVLADTGFGGGGPLYPVPLRAPETEAAQDEWTYRLTDEGDGVWALSSRTGDTWDELYGFTEDPRYRGDYAILSHYLSTSPRSPFTGRLMVQHTEASVRRRLTDTALTEEHPDGTVDRRDLAPEEVPEAIRDVFGITLTRDDAEAVAKAAAGFTEED
ncbi:arylamine N-acetyltransferase family protein [Nocardiopsis potens]|uniref:arylamine N-acetyltransferase family protein n=1 Tax=Nocardiopsis potens TaxID=1246458 RepID=UPI0003489DDC|nr:arylamine N-acetyltransferase [Nocardiopsis potens]